MIALYRTSTLFALGPLLLHTAASVIKRDATYSQIRFLTCADNTIRMITYNDWSPKPMQFPDDVLVGDFTQANFLPGSDLEGTSYTRKVPWKVHTQPHGSEANMFKSFVGTATYGNEGFNCA
jgi:hypothetical protein